MWYYETTYYDLLRLPRDHSLLTTVLWYERSYYSCRKVLGFAGFSRQTVTDEQYGKLFKYFGHLILLEETLKEPLPPHMYTIYLMFNKPVIHRIHFQIYESATLIKYLAMSTYIRVLIDRYKSAIYRYLKTSNKNRIQVRKSAKRKCYALFNKLVILRTILKY